MNKGRNIILTVALLFVNIFLILAYNIHNIKEIKIENKITNNFTYFETNDNNINIYDDICYEKSLYTYNDKIEINNGLNNIHEKSNIQNEELKNILKGTNLENYSSIFLECEEKYNVNALLLVSIVINQTGWGNYSNNIKNDIYYYANSFNEFNSNSLQELQNKGFVSDPNWSKNIELINLNLIK